MNSDLLLKIYLAVTRKKEKYKYPPVRKNHNMHLFG